MESLFLALIQQLNTSVFTLICILLVTFWLVYKSGGWVKSYEDFENKSDKFDAKIDLIKTDLSSIKATTDLLYQTHLNTVRSHSPLSLTEVGREVLEGVSVSQKVNDHWSDIKSRIEKQKPVNPYDIQTVSMDIARNCFETIFTHKEQDEIKSYAFEKGMNLLQIYPVIGIEIRNKYLKERGIQEKEVDAHDPSKKS